MYNILPKTLFVGKSLNYLPSCHSTNDSALNLVHQQNAFEGTVVITDNQLAGKGQQGTEWEAEPYSNLTFSVILFPKINAFNHFDLNIIVSLAILEALKVFIENFPIVVKWPNDIYVNNKKISGVLIQNIIRSNKIQSSVIGIGINVNQDTFKESKAISLRNILQLPLKKETVLETVLEKIEKYYLMFNNNRNKMFELYINNLYGRAEKRTFYDKEEKPFEGTIVGIDGTGRLLIEINNVVNHFNFKEVKFCNA